MSGTQAGPVDLKLEVVVLGVADVDRAKAFYERLGWRLDADFALGPDYRVVQLTPPRSGASIIFGKGLAAPAPGAVNSLVLAVDDVDAARAALTAAGAAVSEVFHFAGGVFGAGAGARVSGRDPQGRSYQSFASFEDPDGNGWLLQEIQARLPGRDWNSAPPAAEATAGLAALLAETAARHGAFEKTHAEHHWWDWYAAYLHSRQRGDDPEAAAAAAGRYMADVLHVLPR